MESTPTEKEKAVPKPKTRILRRKVNPKETEEEKCRAIKYIA